MRKTNRNDLTLEENSRKPWSSSPCLNPPFVCGVYVVQSSITHQEPVMCQFIPPDQFNSFRDAAKPGMTNKHTHTHTQYYN